MSGLKYSSTNLCDFICYHYPKLFCMECKSVQGNTFPLTNYTQYTRMLQYVNITGVTCGVILWFVDHDRIIFVPTETFSKLKEAGAKSVNIKTIQPDTYFYIDIPVKKRRIFLDADYSVLI